MVHDVFISHSSKDKLTADAICHSLEQNGIRCWIAPRDVRAGETYGAEIINAIKECKVFLLIFSENSNASEDVVNEIQNAFKRSKVIIPYRLDKSKMSDEMEYFLSRKHWIDAYPNDKVFSQLVVSVKNTLHMPVEENSKTLVSEKNTNTKSVNQKSGGLSKLLKWAIPAAVIAIMLGTILLLIRPKTPTAINSGNNSVHLATENVDNKNNVPFNTSSKKYGNIMANGVSGYRYAYSDVDNSIYTVSMLSRRGNGRYGLSKIDLSKKDKQVELIADFNNTYKKDIDCGGIHIINGFIYLFGGGLEGRCGIFKISLKNPNSIQQLSDERISHMIIIDDTIFYTQIRSFDDSGNQPICSMDINGNNITVLNQDRGMLVTSLFSVDDWIFFVREGELFRMNFDGNNIVKLSDKRDFEINNISTDGNLLFFDKSVNMNVQDGLFSTNLSMKNIQQISEQRMHGILVNDDYIFYGVYSFGSPEIDNCTLFRMNKNGTNITEISKFNGAHLSVIDENSQELLWGEKNTVVLSDYYGMNKKLITDRVFRSME